MNSHFLSGAEEYNVDHDESEENKNNESDESLSQVYEKTKSFNSKKGHDSKVYI